VHPESQSPTTKRLHAGAFVVLLALLAVTIAVYWQGLVGPFLIDDYALLPQAQLEALSQRSLATQFFAIDYPYPAVRGLGRVSLAITATIHGLDDAWAFKYQNLLLHLVNGLLIFWLLLVLMRHRRPLDHVDPVWIAVGVTAIWLLHPLQVSTVLYPVQRLTLLSSLFMVAAVLAYVKGRLLALRSPRTGLAVAVVGVLVFTLLGLLSKETAALIPLLIAVVEVFILRFQFRPAGTAAAGQGPSGLVAVGFIALFGVPLLVGLLYAGTHFQELIGNYAIRPFTLPERLLTQVHVLMLYLKQILIPLPASMSLFHDDFPVTRGLDLSTVVKAALLALLIWLAVLLRKPAPWIGLGILWFFACHALESSFLGLELVFEHRNYLALLGPALILTILLIQALDAEPIRRLRLPLVTALVALLAFNTTARAMVWGNHELLLVTQYERHPESVRVLAGLFNLRIRQGATEEAMGYLDELKALSRHEAAPFIGGLQLGCRQAAPDAEDMAGAIQRLEHGFVAGFTINALRDLSDEIMRHRCPALGRDEMNALFDAAAANPLLPTSETCYLHEIRVRHDLAADDRRAGLMHLRIALQYCDRTGRLGYQFLIENLLRFAADRGQLADALALLADAARRPDKSDITNAFPDWLSAEMITPAGIQQLRAQGQ
jgi:hypothetical protein